MAKRRYFSLNLKLYLSTIPLIFIFMGFSYWVVLRHETAILRQETEQRASSLAAGMSILSSEAMRTFSNYLLQQNAEQFTRLKDVSYVMVVDEQGRVLAHSQPGERGKTYDDPHHLSAIASDEERLAYIETDGQQVLDVARPITIDNKRLGTVRVGLSLAGLQAALAQSFRYLTGLTLVLLAGATLFAGVLAQWFTRPLLHLARVSREVALGNLDARAKTDSSDEVGLLGTAVNQMAARLQGMLDAEKEARERLQERVHNLLEFAGRVQGGDLTGQAPPGEDDEMGQLIMAVNEMVRHLRIILEEERSMRADLERSRSELERVNEKLKELDRMKSEFLNTVSHELRTPLTSIKAFAEILLDNAGEDPETQSEFLEIINKESDRLTRLINNLLDLSRIEAGRMKWEDEPVDVKEVVTSAAASLRGAAEKKGLVFEALCEEQLPTRGDRDKLVQVVTNLLGNAIKFTNEGGRVRIQAHKREQEIEIVVSDSGMGIAPEFHQTIFEKFSQVDTSETRDIKGSGLGLPIARSIIEHHNGTISVESELGEGARFIVRIPLVEEKAPPRLALPRNRLADWSDGRRVLVVDDEANIRRVLRHLLEGEGFQVLEARNGEEAVKLAGSDKPHLVLLDLVLPDINGFDVLAALKKDEKTREIPVIILSIIEDREKCYRLGASDYLPKPIDRDRLVERVGSLLADGKAEVLAVDDDDSVLRVLQTILSARGYTVRVARSGEKALEEVERQPPDLILLDLMMPGISGHEVLLRLKQSPETAGIPVIILTAAEPDERIRALSSGARTLVTKPFTEKELARMVRETLAEVALEPGASSPGNEGQN